MKVYFGSQLLVGLLLFSMGVSAQESVSKEWNQVFAASTCSNAPETYFSANSSDYGLSTSASDFEIKFRNENGRLAKTTLRYVNNGRDVQIGLMRSYWSRALVLDFSQPSEQPQEIFVSGQYSYPIVGGSSYVEAASIKDNSWFTGEIESFYSVLSRMKVGIVTEQDDFDRKKAVLNCLVDTVYNLKRLR